MEVLKPILLPSRFLCALRHYPRLYLRDNKIRKAGRPLPTTPSVANPRLMSIGGLLGKVTRKTRA